MSGQQLLDTLRQLGYPGVDQLNTSGLDWMFDDEAVLPFLHWACTSLSSDNVLHSAQIQQYEEVFMNGECLLEGAQLDQALYSLSISDEQDITDEALQEEISKLQEEREHYKKKKQNLLQQRNRLSVHSSSLTHRLSQVPQLEKKAKRKYKQKLEQSQAVSKKADCALRHLSGALQDVSCIYIAHDNQQAYFLSQINLESYHETEQTFTEQITAYARKQFFEGITELVGHNDGKNYELIEVNRPESLLDRGDKESVNLADCQELARLEAVYPHNECDYLNAVMSERGASEACRTAEERILVNRDHTMTSDLNKLSDQIELTQSKLLQVQDSINILPNQVTALIKGSSGLQVSKILSGDYNLKIIRQDYLISNQDKVINQLVLQRSRYELLKIVYELELQQHRHLHHLLAAAAQHLNNEQQQKENRLAMMDDDCLSLERHRRETINNRDTFMMSLYHILNELETRDEQQLYVTNGSLNKSAGSLAHRLHNLQSIVASSHSEQTQNMVNLEQSLKSCKDIVYVGASTDVGAIQLGPKNVRDSIGQLTTMLNGLEQSIIDIVKNLDQKKEMLTNDSLFRGERDIYLHFFNRPGKLNDLTDQLTAGINSLSVQ